MMRAHVVTLFGIQLPYPERTLTTNTVNVTVVVHTLARRLYNDVSFTCGDGKLRIKFISARVWWNNVSAEMRIKYRFWNSRVIKHFNKY